jgi:cell wall assembly regulator SMI1
MDAEHLQRALDDIREWFGDAGLAPTLDNLAPAASEAVLDELARQLGVALPAELRWLYLQHDGQHSLDAYPLFGPLGFLPVRHVRRARTGMLMSYFGVNQADASVDTPAERRDVFDDPKRPLSAAELNAGWIPFANVDGDFLAVHGVSGRVIEILKGDVPAIRVIAEDFGEFLGGYADDLWNDAYVITGDPDEPGVEQDGLRTLRAYAGRL